jgi:AcrB/AcrD/AcrF family
MGTSITDNPSSRRIQCIHDGRLVRPCEIGEVALWKVILMRGTEAKFRSPHNAMLEASLARFRPIMMASLTAILGTLPIALVVGAGVEARRPLGMVVVGGLLYSQPLTMCLTPVFFQHGTVRGIGVPRANTRDITIEATNGLNAIDPAAEVTS